MSDIVERLRRDLMKISYDDIEAMVREAAEEIERHMREKVALAGMVASLRDEVERLRAALQALHDWNVEYARINNLFNDDGTPATFHELLEARRALEPKP